MSQPPQTPNAAAPSVHEMEPPKELISYYESLGMDSQQASVKVIEDLQNVISSDKAEKDKRLNEN